MSPKPYAVLLLSALLWFGCAEAPTDGFGEAAEADVSLSASKNGQQTVTGHVEVPVGIIEKYSFSAVRHADGSVTGQWQVKNKFGPGANFTVHGDVTCFTVAPDGKTVFLGGTIAQNSFGIPAGFEANWTVVDNGEGGNAPADLATDLTFGFPPGSPAGGVSHCATGAGLTNIPPTPIIRGNIQVNP